MISYYLSELRVTQKGIVKAPKTATFLEEGYVIFDLIYIIILPLSLLNGYLQISRKAL